MWTMTVQKRWRAPVAGTVVLLASCLPQAWPSPVDEETAWVEGEPGVVFQGMTVDEVSGCSTAVVRGLSQQLVDAVNCARPTTLVPFEHPQLQTGAAVWPYLQEPAQLALLGALEERGSTMTVNSAFRTLAQQYLLYTWYERSQCSISLAARPGRSNHESGLALDLQDHAEWKPTLEGFGWLWLGSSDPVHFDFAGGGTVNLSTLSVQAFQELWNKNHPEDLLEVDGLYGPNTESRLRQSPAEGFPLVLCDLTQPGGNTGGADGGTSGEEGSAGDGTDPTVEIACMCAAPRAGVAPGLGLLLLALRTTRRRQAPSRSTTRSSSACVL